MKDFVFQSDNSQCSLLSYYIRKYKKSNLLQLIRQFLKWILDEFNVDAVQQMVQMKDKVGRSFLYQIVKNDSGNEASFTLLEILNFIKIEIGFDQDQMKDFVFQSNNTQCSLLSYFIRKYKNSDLSHLFKLFIWIMNELGVNAYKEIISAVDKHRRSFLYNITYNDNANKPSFVLIEILDFMKNETGFDQDQLKTFIFKTDMCKNSLLHHYTTKYKKSKLPDLIQQFLGWILSEFGNEAVKELVLMRDGHGHSFLYHMVLNDKDNEAPSALVKILNLIKTETKFDHDQLKKFVFQTEKRSLLHYFAMKNKTFNLSQLLQKFLEWILNSFGVNAVEEIITMRDDRERSFIYNILLNDNDNQAPSSLIQILNLLKIEFNATNHLLFSLIYSETDAGKSILHIICKDYKISNMKNLLLLLINWLNENLTQSQLNDLLFCKTDEGTVFLQILLERPENCEKDEVGKEGNSDLMEKNKLHRKCCNISHEIIMKLDEIVSDKNSLNSLLQQKHRDNISLIEYLISQSENEYLIEWLKSHP
jgi:hypothetical protein